MTKFEILALQKAAIVLKLHHTELERCYATINELREALELSLMVIKAYADAIGGIDAGSATDSAVKQIKAALERTAP